jgi:hypothetical protein
MRKYLLGAYPNPLGVTLSGFRQGVTNAPFVSGGLFLRFQNKRPISKHIYLSPCLRER